MVCSEASVSLCVKTNHASSQRKLPRSSCSKRDVAIVNGKEFPNDLYEYSEGRGNLNVYVISESVLYRILAKCSLPKCEPFETWGFDEVLPSMETPIKKSQHETHIIHNQNSYSSPDIGIGSQTFCGVRGYEKEGVAYLHIEDVVRGLGFVQVAVQNGKEYTKARWSRVEGFLNDLGFAPQVEQSGNPHDYYIPENIFYRLCMKAKNEVAEAFQAKVADEIIPSIRKTGSYSVTTPALPDFTNPAKALR